MRTKLTGPGYGGGKPAGVAKNFATSAANASTPVVEPPREVVAELHARGIYAGPIVDDETFNLAFTERRTAHDIDALVEALTEVGKK